MKLMQGLFCVGLLSGLCLTATAQTAPEAITPGQSLRLQKVFLQRIKGDAIADAALSRLAECSDPRISAQFGAQDPRLSVLLISCGEPNSSGPAPLHISGSWFIKQNFKIQDNGSGGILVDLAMQEAVTQGEDIVLRLTDQAVITKNALITVLRQTCQMKQAGQMAKTARGMQLALGRIQGQIAKIPTVLP